jgi:thiamine-phosphate diphosphorylase
MLHLRLPDEGAGSLTQIARSLVAALDIPVIVHGRVDVALAARAAGVHLGVHDLPVRDARRLVGADFLIGRSAATVADLSQSADADYVTLGPLFASDTRRSGPAIGISEFETMVRSAAVPVVAIGGISASSAVEAVRAGASGVAMISAILGSRDPEHAAREVRSAIGT